MSRILRRPMFRGGRVDSRGTGIASGLSYEKGGRVGYATGGDIMARLSNFFTKPALNPDGTPITLPQRNFIEDASFLIGPGKFLKAGGGGLNLIRQMGKQPLFPSGYKAGFKKGMKSGEPEAAPFLSNKYFKDLISPYTSGMKELSKEAIGTVKDYGIPFGIGSLGAGFGLKKGYDAFMSKDEDPEKQNAALLEAEEKAKRDREFAEYMEKLASNKVEKIKSDIGGKEQIDIDKEIFADALGKKKARIEDASNMALGFAARAFEDEATTKSALGKFFADEAKRPSAASKIDQAAGSAAINKYIKGEISKAELDKFFAQTDYKMSFASKRGKQNVAENIIEAGKTFGTGYKSIDYGLRRSFPEAGTPIKLDTDKGDSIDNVPLTVDNVDRIFIEDEAPYRAIMITVVDGQLIRDPLN
jgi:hypothetical protein